jgi:hypothetical protein
MSNGVSQINDSGFPRASNSVLMLDRTIADSFV